MRAHRGSSDRPGSVKPIPQRSSQPRQHGSTRSRSVCSGLVPWVSWPRLSASGWLSRSPSASASAWRRLSWSPPGARKRPAESIRWPEATTAATARAVRSCEVASVPSPGRRDADPAWGRALWPSSAGMGPARAARPRLGVRGRALRRARGLVGSEPSALGPRTSMPPIAGGRGAAACRRTWPSRAPQSSLLSSRKLLPVVESVNTSCESIRGDRRPPLTAGGHLSRDYSTVCITYLSTCRLDWSVDVLLPAASSQPCLSS